MTSKTSTTKSDKFQQYARARSRFEKAEGKDIAVISVKPSPHPVYLKCGGEKEEFYIRSGNSSQRLEVSEATFFIKEHWPDS
jgi:hypothetical protein